MAEDPLPFVRLDFVYMPSRDTAADLRHFTEELGGRAVFAIEAFDARVAMVELAEGPPALLLADHLEGERPVLVFRVEDLDAAVAGLERGGARVGARFGIPHGPICSLDLPGGQRLAIYERTRPEADERLAGRRDF
ncbi:MAG: VOC family protein [Thermoleophilaceae bacterium]